MGMFWTAVDPYAGLAESIVTSNVLDARDAFDIGFSWYTTSGTSSVFTYQVSNTSVEGVGSIPAASWSNWTFVVPTSGASVMEPPLSYGYARLLRTTSGASFQFDWRKQVQR